MHSSSGKQVRAYSLDYGEAIAPSDLGCITAAVRNFSTAERRTPYEKLGRGWRK